MLDLSHSEKIELARVNLHLQVQAICGFLNIKLGYVNLEADMTANLSHFFHCFTLNVKSNYINRQTGLGIYPSFVRSRSNLEIL